MKTKQMIDGFINEKSVAVVGVSGKQKKFGYASFTELKAKGYKVFPVNPAVNNIDGERCYPDLKSLPEKVGWALTVVPPHVTEEVVKDAYSAGIKKIWMQQGSESVSAIKYCDEKGIDVVHGECVLMFAHPKSIHRFHRWVWGIFGKLPS